MIIAHRSSSQKASKARAKDALKIVKWWVESQLKIKKAFRKSVFYALERFSFYTKVEDSNAAALYDYDAAAHLFEHYVTQFWHKTMNEKDAIEMKVALESKGEVQLEVSTLKKTVTIKRSMVSISKETQKVHHRTFKSVVIESSFVMERIIYCLFEHSFYTRPSEAGEEEIYVFGFSPLAAPVQCPIFSLALDQQYKEDAKQINDSLSAAGISNGVYPWDDSTIELQYKAADATGTPFSITVVSTSSVTIRERDTQDQIFVSVEKVAAVVKELCEGRSKWADVLKKYPAALGADRTTLNTETI